MPGCLEFGPKGSQLGCLCRDKYDWHPAVGECVGATDSSISTAYFVFFSHREVDIRDLGNSLG